MPPRTVPPSRSPTRWRWLCASAARRSRCSRPGRAGELVAGYDLVVFGAPLYSGRWHRDARRFLRRHRRELAAVPVAVFAMGPRTGTEEAPGSALAPNSTGPLASRHRQSGMMLLRAWLPAPRPRVIHAGITRRLRGTPGAGAGLFARDAADGGKPQERNHTVGSLQIPAVVRCDLQDPRPPRGGILSGQFLRADLYRCALDLHVRMRISFQVEIPARVGGQAAVGG